MRAVRARAGVLVAAVCAVLLAGCGAGGFDQSAPERPTGPTTFKNYVAIGDGFAAAPYLGADVSKTDCLRSATNYPSQVARALQVATVTDVTCTGATTADLTATSSPPGSKRKLAPQLDAVTKDTDLVSIGVGIEDNGLLQNMFRVCQAEPCGTQVLGPPLARQIDAYGASIATIVRTIQDVAPNATILVVGYPQIMPKEGRCDALPPSTEKQLSVAYSVLGQVNGFLRSAAFQTGASYIDVAEISDDHTACSAEPWVSGATTKKGTSQALHPVAAEQQAVAQAIVDQVRILS